MLLRGSIALLSQQALCGSTVCSCLLQLLCTASTARTTCACGGMAACFCAPGAGRHARVQACVLSQRRAPCSCKSSVLAGVALPQRGRGGQRPRQPRHLPAAPVCWLVQHRCERVPGPGACQRGVLRRAAVSILCPHRRAAPAVRRLREADALHPCKCSGLACTPRLVRTVLRCGVIDLHTRAVALQANAQCGRAGVAEHTSNPGLLQQAGWEAMSVTAAAQAVQVSAFPDAYAQWEGLAREIVKKEGGGGGGVTDPPTPEPPAPGGGTGAQSFGMVGSVANRREGLLSSGFGVKQASKLP